MDDEREMIKIKIHVHNGKVGGLVETVVEFDAGEWEDMDEKEQEEFCREEMFNLIDWGYEVVEDDQ